MRLLLLFKSRLSLRRKRSGWGLAFLMMFVATSVMIAASLSLMSAPVNVRYVGQASQANQSAYELAMIGLNTVESDMRTRLDAGQTLDTSYTYPVTAVSMPQDPSNLSVLNASVGSYSATMTRVRGYTYLVKVTASVGGASVQVSRLLQMTSQTYDCTMIEDQILAGGIASISDSNLISYAQNNCMLKTASTTVTTPNAGAGASGCGTYSGSGTLSLATNNCGTVTANGTYSTIQFRSTTSTSGTGRVLYSSPAAGFTGTRTIHIPGTVGDYDWFYAKTSGGTKSTFPHTFLFSAAALTHSFETRGGNSDDIFSYNGGSTSDVYTSNGNNTVIVNGTWGNCSDGNYMQLGDSGNTGTNTVYLNAIKGGTGGATIETFSSGQTRIYFNNLSGDAVDIFGGSANDIIGCGVSFTGGTGTCGAAVAGTYTFEGKGGSDIISMDLLPPSGTTINGNTGTTSETSPNIIYTKGCSGSTNIRTNNTASLVISGGNRASGCVINGQTGGNSVLLKKSGTTDAGTNSNFARTLSY